MRSLRLLAAAGFIAATAFLGISAETPAFAMDAKVNVYPSTVWNEDPVVMTVEHAPGCDRRGSAKLLVDGAEPRWGWDIQFYGDDSVIAINGRPLNIPDARRYEMQVICTDPGGKQTTYRAGFDRQASNGIVRPSMVPVFTRGTDVINVDNYEQCQVSATIDGRPAPLVDAPPSHLELRYPVLTPGIHLVTLTCNGNQVTYPLAVDGLTAGQTGTSGGPGAAAPAAPYEPVNVFLAVPTPNTVVINPIVIAATILIAGVVILLIGFPAEFVNKTIEANEQQINSWFGGTGNALRRLGKALKPWQWFFVYCGLTALLTTLVDPLSGFNLTTLITVLAFAIAVPLTTIVYSGVREVFTRRISGVPGIIHTIPRALLLALVMALVSRIAGFQPGYVYGLVAGYVALRERRLPAKRDSATVIAGSVALFVLSLTAWFTLGTVHAQAGMPDAGFVVRLWDGVLCATFLLGVQTLVFGLIPLRFLDGHVLRQWNIRMWALVYAPGIMLFILLLGFNSETAAQRGVGAGLISSLVLFLAFGVGSMLFWAFFRLRQPGPAGQPAMAGVPQQVAPTEPDPAHTTSTGRPDVAE